MTDPSLPIMPSPATPMPTQIHGTLNLVGGNQINQNNYNVHPQGREPGPGPPQSINDCPMGRLSVHFIGREKEVGRLKDALSIAQNDIPNCCAVYGMPGVGKSQLILHFAQISFNQRQYSYIFWISATSVDKLNDGLSNVLDLVRHPDRYLQEQKAKLTAARLWLEESQDNWLLIFDNVEKSTMDFFQTHLPRRNGRGNILFTTRTKDAAEALVTIGGNRATFQLHPLELRDSTNLLLQDAGVDTQTVIPSQLSRAEKLVECVGRLPLAVVQAASFMKKTHTTLDEMYDVYMGDEKIDVVEWENDLTQYQERSVATTFTKQFSELQKESVDISNLLKILSFLDPENISVAMITKGAKEWLNPHRLLGDIPSQSEHDSHIFPDFRSLVALICSTVKFRTAVEKLQALSLVEYRFTDQDSSLWIHDLVRFIRHQGAKKEDAYREWLQSSISLVCAASRQISDPESPVSWAECEEFIPHLRSLNRWSNEYGTNLELLDANGWIATYLRSRGRYDDAELLWKQVVEAYETKFGFEHPLTLTSVHNLAFVYHSQGRYNEAEKLYERALTGRENHLGANHPSMLTSMNNLAFVYRLQGRYDKAETLLKQALAGKEVHLGPSHLDTLASVNNLGDVYQSQTRYDEAKACYERSLAGYEARLGPNHPDTLMSVNNLACVYQSQGQFAKAEPHLKRALDGKENSLGANHPETLLSLSNLAGVYNSQGRYAEAETLFRRALANSEDHLGATHPNMLFPLSGLTVVYQLQGQYDEAERFSKRAVALSEERLGTNHPDTLKFVYNLACVHQSQGRYDESETLYQRALAGLKKSLCPDHPTTQSVTTNLLHLYLSHGRREKAAFILQRYILSAKLVRISRNP